MNARMRRITSDYEQIKKNFANHKNIVVEPMSPEPVEKYRVTYYLNGIYMLPDGRIETNNKHIVIINLHADYPRYKPICTIATPIWHPNFRDGQICIGDIWGAGESLSDIIINIGDMIQYKSWNSFSPLSADAAEWAIENKHLFPIGNINLWTGEEEDGTVKKDFEIEFEDDEPSDGSLETEVLADVPISDPDMSALYENKTPDPSVEFTQMSSSNDFEITAEELQGIEFVPSAVRMQGSAHGATAKGGKVNFKTIFFKGILWALIGAVIGFGLQELLNKPTNNTSILRLMGETEYADYLDADNEFNEYVAIVLDKYGIDENGKDKNGQEFDISTLSEEEIEQLAKLSEDRNNKLEAFANAKGLTEMDEDEINTFFEEIEKTQNTAQRISSGLFSALVALGLGLLLGIGEGVYYGSKQKALIYAVLGLVVGTLLGFLSGFLGQMLYSSLLKDTTETTSEIYIAFVRAISWALMGAGIGISTGLIKPEKMRVLNCTLGGLIGGFVGGFAFNFITKIKLSPTDDGIISRAIGIIFMGVLIGLGIGLLEQFAKSAWLKVIRGEFEGKEYLVFEGKTSIGNSGKNSIVLFKDKLIAPNHCDILQEGNKYVLIDKGSPLGTVVNGMRVTRHVLKQGDAIAIGNSVLVFNTK